MTVQEIFDFLCAWAPLSTALSYDNPGLLVGDANATVKKAVVALDCTASVIEKAKQVGAQLIVTHHPVIFEPLRQVTAQAADSRVYRLVQAGISVISMHTNLDSAPGGVNDCLAAVLGLENVTPVQCEDGFSFRMGSLKAPLSAVQLAQLVQQKLQCTVRFTAGSKPILKVAVCGGSGADLLQIARQSGADALVTADVKHSCFIAAAEQDFTLIDAGHYKTENTVIEPLCEFLRRQCGNTEFISAELPLYELPNH